MTVYTDDALHKISLVKMCYYVVKLDETGTDNFLYGYIEEMAE